MSETDQTTTTAPEVAAPDAVATQDPHLTQGGTHVLMVREETGGVWESPIDYADIALADGWRFAAPDVTNDPGTHVAEALAVYAAESAPEVDTSQTGFNPAEHSVVEVDAYIAAHFEASPGEAARVLELERSGKDRATVKDPFDSGAAGN